MTGLVEECNWDSVMFDSCHTTLRARLFWFYCNIAEFKRNTVCALYVISVDNITHFTSGRMYEDFCSVTRKMATTLSELPQVTNFHSVVNNEVNGIWTPLSRQCTN